MKDELISNKFKPTLWILVVIRVNYSFSLSLAFLLGQRISYIDPLQGWTEGYRVHRKSRPWWPCRVHAWTHPTGGSRWAVTIATGCKVTWTKLMICLKFLMEKKIFLLFSSNLFFLVHSPNVNDWMLFHSIFHFTFPVLLWVWPSSQIRVGLTLLQKTNYMYYFWVLCIQSAGFKKKNLSWSILILRHFICNYIDRFRLCVFF